MLQIADIQKSFGSYHVFRIDKLILNAGIYRLKGINGSGKSTLIKILAGLLPFKGEIFLNETISIRKNPVQYRLAVNHSEAEPVYPSFLTGTELVEFAMTVKKGTNNQVNETKRLLNIDNYLDNPTGGYSSGMLKKLSLLMAFTGQPQWILLDEPLTTLDQVSQKALCDLIMQQHQNGISFIITSHHDVDRSDIEFDKVFMFKDKTIHEVSH